jgi:hypothetical protein
MKDGKVSYCKPCDKERKNTLRRKWVKEGNASYKRQRRDNKLKERYGINQDVYEEMLEQQKGCCKICGTSDPGDSKTHFLYVDHCHETLNVRGLLCRGCNTGLGAFKDNIDSLKNAIKYLEDSRE